MQSELPFYEGPEDALRAAVQHLGGAKKVGAMLWQDMLADEAARKLLDCLSTHRPEKLKLTQMMFILRQARDAQFHAPFTWLAAELGYEARPVTQAEEVDKIAAVLEQSTKTTAACLAMLERLQRAQQAPVSSLRAAA